MRLIRGVDVDQRVAVSPTGYRPEPGLVGTIRAFVFGIKTLTWLACLLISIVSLAFPGITSLASVQWTPWIVGIFIFGLSHGGLDDEVSSMAGRTGGRTGCLQVAPRCTPQFGELPADARTGRIVWTLS
jgi:hypothetical protein